jgi:PAS domain S-box-containing protein
MTRTRRTRINSRLGRLTTPVFLIDADRHVIFFNRGCEELTGWNADEVIGRRCEYAGHADRGQVESLTGSLCPPPAAFAGEETQVPAFLQTKAGRSVARLIHFHPLRGDDGVDCVLGLIGEIESPKVPPVRPSQRLHAELMSLRATLRKRFALETLIARGPAMRRVLRQVAAARESREPLLLSGERGTGKEHVARLLHQGGPTRNNAFVPLDCRRTEPIDLKLTLRRAFRAEAEASASPGSPSQPLLRPGTIYLAHIDAMPRDVQESLVELTGDETLLRLIAATEWPADSLRGDVLIDDLYYRITPLVIALPPLRRRREELPLLAQAMLEEQNRGAERQVGGFDEAVWSLFAEYNWPGNLDELASVVEAAAASSGGPLVTPADLPFAFRTGFDAQTIGPPAAPEVKPLEPYLEQVERTCIEEALVQARYNKSRAAELLGITRPKLYRRMETLGIEDREELEGRP